MLWLAKCNQGSRLKSIFSRPEHQHEKTRKRSSSHLGIENSPAQLDHSGDHEVVVKNPLRNRADSGSSPRILPKSTGSFRNSSTLSRKSRTRNSGSNICTTGLQINETFGGTRSRGRSGDNVLPGDVLDEMRQRVSSRGHSISYSPTRVHTARNAAAFHQDDSPWENMAIMQRCESDTVAYSNQRKMTAPSSLYSSRQRFGGTDTGKPSDALRVAVFTPSTVLDDLPPPPSELPPPPPLLEK